MTHERSCVVTGPAQYDYEHDYTQGDFAYPDGRSIVEVGLQYTLLVRLSDIHELPQIRETISEKEIEDLARAIIRSSDMLACAQTAEEISAALDLMHPPELIALQPQELETFLADHADFYGLPEPVVIPRHEQLVLIQNAGHRRRRAIEHIIVKIKGLSLEDVAMRCAVHSGLTFAGANRRQAKENTHVQTSPLEDANNIIRYYRFVERHEGRLPTVAEIAGLYGFSETKVRTALAFDSLPADVKVLAGGIKGEEQLPLSYLAALAPLYEAYRQRYDARMHNDASMYPIDQRDTYTATEIELFAIRRAVDRKEGKSAEQLYRLLDAEKNNVKGELAIAEDALLLFDVERVPAGKQREAAYRRLGKNCLYGTELAAKQGVLDTKDIARLKEIVKIAEDHARPAAEVTEQGLF